MTIARKDFALLTEVYDGMNTPESDAPMSDAPMGSAPTNNDYKVGDIVNGIDGEEVIVSIESGTIRTRTLEPNGNQYEPPYAELSKSADEAEEEGGDYM